MVRDFCDMEIPKKIPNITATSPCLTLKYLIVVVKVYFRIGLGLVLILVKLVQTYFIFDFIGGNLASHPEG